MGQTPRIRPSRKCAGCDESHTFKTDTNRAKANRAKAPKSSGPTTLEGKEKSKLNNLRHGLTGAAFLITEEERVAYEAFCGPFVESLEPANPLERSTANLIAVAHWRLARIHAMEETTFSFWPYACGVGEDARAHLAIFEAKAEQFRNFSLYEQRITRDMHRNLKALQDMQRERRQAEDRVKAQGRREAEEAKRKAEAERTAPQPKVKTASASAAPVETQPNGFEFSNDQMPGTAPLETPPHEVKNDETNALKTAA
jgi:hypothetical protein